MPFKDIFKYCDASGIDTWKNTTGPSYYGNIAKHFKNGLELKQPVQFRPIPGKVPTYAQNFVATLNNDGRYLYEICHAVQNGVVSPELAIKLIGHVHSARYGSSRVLRFRIRHHMHHNI